MMPRASTRTPQNRPRASLCSKRTKFCSCSGTCLFGTWSTTSSNATRAPKSRLDRWCCCWHTHLRLPSVRGSSSSQRTYNDNEISLKLFVYPLFLLSCLRTENNASGRKAYIPYKGLRCRERRSSHRAIDSGFYVPIKTTRNDVVISVRKVDGHLLSSLLFSFSLLLLLFSSSLNVKCFDLKYKKRTKINKTEITLWDCQHQKQFSILSPYLKPHFFKSLFYYLLFFIHCIKTILFY